MEKLYDVLFELDETVNWIEETSLIDDHLLDSFGVISLVSELEDTFDVEISALEMIPENFNSADAMWRMILKLQEK